MAKKVTGKAAASATSKALRDGRVSATSKTAAESALLKEKKMERENKQKSKERREFLNLRSFNIYHLSIDIKLNYLIKLVYICGPASYQYEYNGKYI